MPFELLIAVTGICIKVNYTYKILTKYLQNYGIVNLFSNSEKFLFNLWQNKKSVNVSYFRNTTNRNWLRGCR